MTQKTDPFIGTNWGYTDGENGWGEGMNENLIKFSFLFNRRIDGIVATLPSSPVNGTAYFNTTDNLAYFRAENQWYNTLIPKGFELILKTTEDRYYFNGTTLINPGPIVTLTSDISVGDIAAQVFKINPVSSVNAAVVVNVSWSANDLSNSCGYLQFTASNNNGVWTIGAVTSFMTNAIAPSVAAAGNVLFIRSNKALGGPASAPTISGLVACAGCRISSV